MFLHHGVFSFTRNRETNLVSEGGEGFPDMLQLMCSVQFYGVHYMLPTLLEITNCDRGPMLALIEFVSNVYNYMTLCKNLRKLLLFGMKSRSSLICFPSK